MWLRTGERANIDLRQICERRHRFPQVSCAVIPTPQMVKRISFENERAI